MMYESRCHLCLKVHNYIRTVDNRADTPLCCGTKTEKVILTAPMGYVQADVCYDSPIDGRPITTRQQRIEDLKRSNSRPWEGMKVEQQEAARRASYDDAAEEKQIAATVEKSLMQISEESRRALVG